VVNQPAHALHTLYATALVVFSVRNSGQKFLSRTNGRRAATSIFYFTFQGEYATIRPVIIEWRP
jgi:hypothetical protein